MQVQERTPSATCGDLRAHAGRIAEENRVTFAGLGVDALVVDPAAPAPAPPLRP